MMPNRARDRCLALAGVFQAAALARQVAREGSADPAARDASIASILAVDADNAAAVFGGPKGVGLGLETLAEQFGGRVPPARREIARYVLALLHLERRLMRRGRIVARLQDGIRQAQTQAGYFSPTHDNVIAALADLYQQTLSLLPPRIMVHGDPAILADTRKANLIRVVLLAGVRAAVLWRQCGGRRRQLLFGRGSLLAEAEALLRST